MDLIVDGYNLIGSERGLTGQLEHKRKRLIQQVVQYQQLKGYEIIIVFDGWRSGAMREAAQTIGGVRVIYSQQGEKADAVIIRIARTKGSGCVVVSSDREIRSAIEKFGAVAISAGEFGRVLRQIDQPYGSKDEEPEPGRRLAGKGDPRRLTKAEKRRVETLKKLRP
jgi:predicted RNA-binding protein with PIN domain